MKVGKRERELLDVIFVGKFKVRVGWYRAELLSVLGNICGVEPIARINRMKSKGLIVVEKGFAKLGPRAPLGYHVADGPEPAAGRCLCAVPGCLPGECPNNSGRQEASGR